MPYPSSNAETTVHAVRRLPTSESRIERSSNGRWEIVSTAPGRPFTERRSVNVGTAAIEFVQEGMGVAIAYAELVEGFRAEELVCIPLEPPIYDKRGLMWRKDRILSSAAQAFLWQLESLIAQ